MTKEKATMVRDAIEFLKNEGLTAEEILGAFVRGFEELSQTNAELVATESIEHKVTDFLRNMGIPAHIKGYNFLRYAICYVMESEEKNPSVTKVIYPATAKQFGTTASRVERAIRHAVEVGWDRGNNEVHEHYFGYTIDFNRGKPTNAEFIFMAVDWLKNK